MKNFKEKARILGVLVVAALCAAVFSPQKGLAADAGTALDPLVSKSYVDAKIAELRAEMANGYAYSGGYLDYPQNAPVIDEGQARFEVVFLQAGRFLFGGEGSEIILRGGQCLSYITDENGIADVTAGRDILNGEVLPFNHLLIVPRAGRGLLTVTDSWIMVRGEYSVQ